jgi:TnpA family transposase
MVENAPLRLQGITLRARVLFHSTVISAAERESAYVIDGLMHNDVVKSDVHSTDTHGYSEMIFGTNWGSGVLGTLERNAE